MSAKVKRVSPSVRYSCLHQRCSLSVVIFITKSSIHLHYTSKSNMNQSASHFIISTFYTGWLKQAPNSSYKPSITNDTLLQTSRHCREWKECCIDHWFPAWRSWPRLGVSKASRGHKALLILRGVRTKNLSIYYIKISGKLISDDTFTGNLLKIHPNRSFYANFLQILSSLFGLIVQFIRRSVVFLNIIWIIHKQVSLPQWSSVSSMIEKGPFKEKFRCKLTGDCVHRWHLLNGEQPPDVASASQLHLVSAFLASWNCQWED